MISSNELGALFSPTLLSARTIAALKATASEPAAVVKNPLEGYDPYLVQWLPQCPGFEPKIKTFYSGDPVSTAKEIDRLNSLYPDSSGVQKFGIWVIGAYAYVGVHYRLHLLNPDRYWYKWDFEPNSDSERVRAEQANLEQIRRNLAAQAARSGSPFAKMKEDIDTGLKKISNWAETLVGYGPEVREEIDRTVYTGVYGAKWRELGPVVTWVLVKLQQQSGSLGQWMAMAGVVTSFASGYFTDERGKETEDKANKEWQGIAANSDPVMTRAFAYLAKKGVMKDTSLESAGALSPEDVQLFADQYIDAEKQDRRGRYYFAFQNIFQQIDDIVSSLEATESAGPAVVQTIVNIAERLSGMLPEGAVTDFEARGWTLDEVIAAVTKSTYGQTLDTQEKEMVELFNQYSGTEEEKKKQAEKQTSSLIMPGLMFAFSLFK